MLRIEIKVNGIDDDGALELQCWFDDIIVEFGCLESVIETGEPDENGERKYVLYAEDQRLLEKLQTVDSVHDCKAEIFVQPLSQEEWQQESNRMDAYAEEKIQEWMKKNATP